MKFCGKFLSSFFARTVVWPPATEHSYALSCHFWLFGQTFLWQVSLLDLSFWGDPRLNADLHKPPKNNSLITVKELSNNIQLPFKSIKYLPNEPRDGTIVLLLPLKCEEIRHILVNKTKIHWWMMRPRHTEASVSESNTVGVRPLVTRPQRGKPKQFATLTLFPRGKKCLS